MCRPRREGRNFHGEDLQVRRFIKHVEKNKTEIVMLLAGMGAVAYAAYLLGRNGNVVSFDPPLSENSAGFVDVDPFERMMDTGRAMTLKVNGVGKFRVQPLPPNEV